MPSMVTPRRSASSAGWVDAAMDAHAVAAQPAGGGQFEDAGEPAVIGEEEETLGVDVEAADGDHPRHVRRAAREKTVGRPSGSRLVVTRPFGLWKSQRRVRSRAASGLPSTSIRSSAVTIVAGVSRTRPFSLTRPSAIIRSASRREQMPARAITLAMRSPLSEAGSATGGLATRFGFAREAPEAGALLADRVNLGLYRSEVSASFRGRSRASGTML